MVHWDPKTQYWKEGIKWFRVLTAIPTDILESNCTVEVLEEAPTSGIEALSVLDEEQHIQMKGPLLSATIPPAGESHLLSNVGGKGSATVRLELRDTLGQEYTGKVTSIEIEENNNVATIVRLDGHYESDQSSGNGTFNDFVWTMVSPILLVVGRAVLRIFPTHISRATLVPRKLLQVVVAH